MQSVWPCSSCPAQWWAARKGLLCMRKVRPELRGKSSSLEQCVICKVHFPASTVCGNLGLPDMLQLAQTLRQSQMTQPWTTTNVFGIGSCAYFLNNVELVSVALCQLTSPFNCRYVTADYHQHRVKDQDELNGTVPEPLGSSHTLCVAHERRSKAQVKMCAIQACSLWPRKCSNRFESHLSTKYKAKRCDSLWRAVLCSHLF